MGGVDSKSSQAFIACEDPYILIEKDVATFRPHCIKEKVVYCQSSRLCTAQDQVFSIKLKIRFSEDAVPVIGFSEARDKPKCFWNLRTGELDLRALGFSSAAHKLLPSCSSNAVVKCTFDMTNNYEVVATFEVEEEGGSQTKGRTERLHGLPRDLLVYVGVLQSGNESVSFQLLSGEVEFHDLTPSVRFTDPSGQVKVSQNGKTVYRWSSQTGNCCVLVNKIITAGQHKFKFLVKCDYGASMCLGLANLPFKLSEDYLSTDTKHIYRHPALIVWRTYQGLLYENGRLLEAHIAPLSWQHGTDIEVEIVVDMTQKTVQISRNGTLLGTPFRDISGPLQPIVAFYASHEKEVELLSYQSTELDDGTQALPDSVRPFREIRVPETVTFDQHTKHGEIELSTNKMTVYRDKNHSGNSLCYLNLVCAEAGVFRFSFIIESDQGASTCIGVSKASRSQSVSVSQAKNIYTSSALYVYRSFQGMVYRAGSELEKKLDEFWMAGSLVEMVIEATEREAVIQYTVNGVDQGTAFAGVELPVWPVVAFYAGMEKKVTLLHVEHRPIARLPSIASSVPPATQPGNSFKTHRVAVKDNTQLPVFVRASDAALYQPECMACGNWTDVIVLPCRHAVFCALHTTVGADCVMCDEKIVSTWNIFFKQ